MSDCLPVSTLITESAMRDIVEIWGTLTDRVTYQELLGFLLFLSTGTRSDISASVGILCLYCSAPRQIHWACLQRILRYLGYTSHGNSFFNGR